MLGQMYGEIIKTVVVRTAITKKNKQKPTIVRKKKEENFIYRFFIDMIYRLNGFILTFIHEIICIFYVNI